MRILLSIFTAFFIFLSPASAFAASLSVASSKSVVSAGSTFTATVLLNTEGVAVNNAEGVISFPSDVLSVDSLSTAGSVFSIWVEQPSFSNANGTVSFNGGAPTPGFNGMAGTVFRITFRAKKEGPAPITFSSGSVYANDGLGTDVLSVKSQLSITIGVADPVQKVTKLPPAPVVTVVDAPDPGVWYAKQDLDFTWDTPEGVTAIRAGWNSKASFVPVIAYPASTVKRSLLKIPDGEWYFHIRYGNSAGFGPVTHRSFKIDNTAPTQLSVVPSEAPDGSVSVAVSAHDALSGIEKYEVYVDGTSVISSPGTVKNILLPRLVEGSHEISVHVSDRAGNTATETVQFSVKKADAPKITSYPEKVTEGGMVSIKGSSYPNSTVRVTFIQDGENREESVVMTNTHGEFSYDGRTIKSLNPVSVFAELVSGSTVVSSPSEIVRILVIKDDSLQVSIESIKKMTIPLPVFLAVVTALILAGLVIRAIERRREARNNPLVREGLAVHKVSEIIHKDIGKSIKSLQTDAVKAALSGEETEAIESLVKTVSEADKFFARRARTLNKISDQ